MVNCSILKHWVKINKAAMFCVFLLKFLPPPLDSAPLRQTNRQTDRQTDRQIDRQTDRQTKRQTDRQTDKQKDIQTDRQTDRGKRAKRINRSIHRYTEI